VQVPSSLPRGTPIALNISIDRLAYITVKGTIGDIPFNVAVVAPSDREAPTPDELGALERRFEEAVGFIPRGQQNVKRLQWDQARDGFRQAAQRGDAAGAVHEFEAMEEIVASLEDVPGPLTPPKVFLDNLVRECLDLHRYVEQTSPSGTPYDGLEMVRSIDAQREQAERAFSAADQPAYTEAIAMLHHIEEHLLDVARNVNPAPPPDEREEAARVVEYGRAKAGKLRDIAAADRPDLAKDVEDIDVELSRLAGQVDSDPVGVLDRARPLLQGLLRIENILGGPPGVPGPNVPIVG